MGKILHKISVTLAKPIDKLNKKMEAFLEWYDPKPEPKPLTKWEKFQEKLNSINIFRRKRK